MEVHWAETRRNRKTRPLESRSRFLDKIEGRRTSATIPSQMPQAVDRVESERKSKYALRSIFHRLREFLHSIDDLLRAECVRSDEVGDREAIEDYQFRVGGEHASDTIGW